MFDRFAAKGPALILGLAAALLTASTARAGSDKKPDPKANPNVVVLKARPGKDGASFKGKRIEGARLPAELRETGPAGRGGVGSKAQPNAGFETMPSPVASGDIAGTGANGPREIPLIKLRGGAAGPSGNRTPGRSPVRVPHPTPSANQPPAGSGGKPSAKIVVKMPRVVDKSIAKRFQTGGTGQVAPGGDADTPVVQGAGFSAIEPRYLPRAPRSSMGSSFVFAANPGGDAYPPVPNPEDTNPDPPDQTQMPAFLVGLNDFHMYFSATGGPVTFGRDANNQGEQFEPSVGENGVLAFSAFWAPRNDIYKPGGDFRTDKGVVFQFDYHGFPVRTIAISNDAIEQNLIGKDASITKLLPPSVVGYREFTKTDDNGENPETKRMPIFAPDASPVIYPLNGRFVVFVSLRGYKPGDPDTHYTRLFVWDTAKDFDAPGSVMPIVSEKGKSILNPTFSPDGAMLAYTVSTQAFNAFDDQIGYAPDPVFDTDVTGAALSEAFQSYVAVRTINIPDPGDGIANVQRGPEVIGSKYADAEGNFSRDMMPFFSELGQLGFSSDRVDTNGDGLGDATELDPTKATFSLYIFKAPFDIDNPSTGDSPDAAARRITLGPAATDKFHELHGSAAKYDQSYVPEVNSVPDLLDVPADLALQPVVIYQTTAVPDLVPDPDATPVIGDWSIWQTDPTLGTPYQYDGNALIGLPQVTGNPALTDAQKLNLSQTHRVGLPGDFVNISVQLNPKYFPLDPDTGKPAYKLAKVHALVKDPDNYIFRPYYDDHVSSGAWTTVYREANAFPVLFSAEDVANYRTLVDDPTAAPDNVVQLLPDETRPGWFTGRWYTPLEASDFMLDVRVARETPAGEIGVYSDNIGGFSTAPFVPTSRVLFVSDFTAGQRSVPRTTGVEGTEDVPAESYFTVRPHSNVASGSRGGSQVPVISRPLGQDRWAVLGPRVEYQEVPALATDPKTGRLVVGPGAVINDKNPMSAFPYAYSPGEDHYDLWRVQCREPITYNDVIAPDGSVRAYGVLRNYIPYSFQAPGYPSIATPRQQYVADRMVFWTAPHAGDLNGNAGANSGDVGTIANITTQQEILQYVQAGGRISLGGNDVAFTLSQNNPQSSNPLLQLFRVRFESDAARDVITNYTYSRLKVNSVDGGSRNGLNPIPYATWEVHYPFTNQPMPSAIDLAPPFDLDIFKKSDYNDNRRNDGAPTNLRIDSITGLNVGQPGGAYPFYQYESGGIGAVMSYAPYPTRNTSSRKTAFFAFGLEGVDRQYVGPLTDGEFGDRPHVHAHNPLALIMHNTVDWMTTTSIRGQVFVTNNVANPSGVLVYAVDDWNQDVSGRVMSTALTDANGNYKLEGLDSSIYMLYAYKTGFTMQHDVRTDGDSIVADFGVNLTLIPAQPGTLRGVVTDDVTGDKLAGVTVRAHDIQDTVNVTAVTDANGQYQFNNLPAGLYIIEVQDGAQVNGKIYGAFTNMDKPVQVNTDPFPNDPQGDTVFNFKLTKRVLPLEPATITVKVFDADISGPAANARVSVTDNSINQLATTLDGGPNPTTTDDSGMAVFHVVSGSYTVKVEYNNATRAFKPQTAIVTALPDKEKPNGNVVEFTFGGILHKFAANTILMASAPYEYNATKGETFEFVLGLTGLNNLVKAYNPLANDFVSYPRYPADTFHLGRGYGMKLPADGKVYEQGADAMTNRKDGKDYYILRADIGWNLIATPFNAPASWNSTGADGVKFALRDDAAQKLHAVNDLNDALTVSNILSPLWGPTRTDADGNGIFDGAYTPAVGTMRPWQAYWVKVAQPTLFYIPRPAPAATAAQKSMASMLMAQSVTTEPEILMPRADVWGVNITASSGDVRDAGLALGISNKATSGFDAGLDMEKPAPLSSSGPSIQTVIRGAGGAAVASDVRGRGANTWTFHVNTNLKGQPVTLSWTANRALPNGAKAYLVDTVTGTRVDMGARTTYTYTAGPAGGERAFRVEVR